MIFYLGLGATDYEPVCNVITNKSKTNSKRGSYKENTDKERLLIGQHTSLYDTASAVRYWKNVKRSHPKKSLSLYDVGAPHCLMKSLKI